MLLKIAKNNDFRQDALGDFYGLLSNGVFLPGSLRSITPEKKDVEKNIKYNFDRHLYTLMYQTKNRMSYM